MVTVGIINRRKQLQIHTMCIHHQLWMPGEMLEKLTSQSLYIVVYMITNYLYIQRYCNANVIECCQTEQQARQTKVHVRRNRTVSSSSAAEAASERRVWIFLVFVRHPTPHKGTKVSMDFRFLQYFTRLSSLAHPHVSTCVYFPPRGADCNSSSSMADLSATKKYKKQHKLPKTVSKGIKTQGMKSSHLGMPNSIEIIYIYMLIFFHFFQILHNTSLFGIFAAKGLKVLAAKALWLHCLRIRRSNGALWWRSLRLAYSALLTGCVEHEGKKHECIICSIYKNWSHQIEVPPTWLRKKVKRMGGSNLIFFML